MRTRIFFFTLSIFICASARGELKWEQTAIELHPTPADKQAIGHFKYQNTGNKPVRFTSVRTSCGCTAAQTRKDEVPPGEKGEITATFNIGDRTGTQVKTVTVETDDPTNATTVLTLKAVIPQDLQIAPTFVFWQQGEAPNPKTIGVSAAKDFPVKHLKVASSSSDFEAKVQETGQGQFQISVQPKATNQPIAAILTIQPDDSRKNFQATARVITKPPVQ
jgi:Protein of unknown function (DUF1573)